MTLLSVKMSLPILVLYGPTERLQLIWKTLCQVKDFSKDYRDFLQSLLCIFVDVSKNIIHRGDQTPLISARCFY